MTILIANIGTSDLAVKLTGFDYYVPIGFDRDQPNLPREDLTDNEAELWNKRGEYVAELLCHELQVPCQQQTRGYSFSFRDLTEQLFYAYRDFPDTWESRICPGRIGGVLQSARDNYHVRDAWIFVTDQNPPQHGDSIFLFEILKLWVERQGWDLTLHSQVLDPAKPANDLDMMLEEYYQFFRNIQINEDILVSIKGGTPQMQTAIKVQTISTGIQHLFLDPQLSVKAILAGDFSDCQPSSYWQYRRSQKYQVVELLLQRWDFDGARQVLKDWKKTLAFLRDRGLPEQPQLSANQKVVDAVIAALDLAVCHLNFDEAGAKTAFQKLRKPKELKQIVNGYDKLLNLYTTCRIFWNLEQIANFLPRLGSFCEETLHQIFLQLNGERYFDRQKYPHDWWLDKRQMEGELFALFSERERQTNANFHQHDFRKKPKYRLPGRFSKRNFAEALILYRKGDMSSWQALDESLVKLDYWVDKRNQIIHSANGVSKQTMQEVLAGDRKLKDQKALAACEPAAIVAEMTEMSRQTYELFGKSSSGLLKFVGPDTPHYLYDEIANWVVEQLMTAGLE